MASRKLPPIVPSAPSSWMDLLAATTLPDAKTGTVQAEIFGDLPMGTKPLRLIVQSRENGHSRVLGSFQRAVTREELCKGVRVRMVELRDAGAPASPSHVIAWVEEGTPDLEFDARRAKPSTDAWVGEALAVSSDVHIVVRREKLRAA